jgi:hypothetical protein
MLSCATPPLSAQPFCNASLPVGERVADLLPRLTLSEKIGQTAMVAPAVPQLGMIRYNFGGEALHGVWSTCTVDNVSTTTRPATGILLLHAHCAYFIWSLFFACPRALLDGITAH